MKRKVARSKLALLAAAIDAVGNLIGIKFTYGVAKNYKTISAELETLAAGLKHSERFKEYEKKRIDLCKKHGKKDENDQPIVVPTPGGRRGAQEYVGVMNNPDFQRDWAELKKGYQGELDEREKLREQHEDALDEEIEFDFYMIKAEDVPENITTAQRCGIVDIIEDEEGEAPPAEAEEKEKQKEE